MSNWPLSSKIIFGLIIAFLLAIGAFTVDDLQHLMKGQNQPQNEEARIEVEFIVRTADSKPVEGVKVEFNFDGAPESRLTNSDGYVRISVPKRKDIDIILTKEGFRTLSRTINLTADEERTISYFLEPEESSVYQDNNPSRANRDFESPPSEVVSNEESATSSNKTSQNEETQGVSEGSTISYLNDEILISVSRIQLNNSPMLADFEVGSTGHSNQKVEAATVGYALVYQSSKKYSIRLLSIDDSPFNEPPFRTRIFEEREPPFATFSVIRLAD